MDNRIISVQSEGRKAFDLAFQLLFDNAPGDTVTHYIDHPKAGLILLWSSESNAIKLPVPLKWKEAADLAWAWLGSKTDKEYTEYCDHDGSNGHGFRVYCEDWGHVGGYHYGVLGVVPVWAWYGK
jgi:hypothetical protein